MSLAANGIAPDAPAGMELLSTEGELGRSQFVERARYKQAMEGELSKTIISLRAVRNARIHLALPERSSFVREVPKPTASVFLDLYPGARLKQPQIQAIVNLVSGSIPDLMPDNVNVLDQNGNMLSTTMVDGVPDWQLEHTLKREQAMAQRVTSLLEPVVGAGNLRVQVTADIDYSTREVTREQFNPESKVVRSENLASDDETTAVAEGVPGVESNRTADTNGRNGVARTRSSSQRNYELNKTISHDTKAPGNLEKLSIGIVVNALAAEGTEGWSPASLDTMNKLVANAVGLQSERGDIISLYSLPFSQQLVTEKSEPWYALFEGEYGVYMLTGLAALLLLIVGLILRMHFYRKQVKQQRTKAMKMKTLRERESKDAAEAGLTIAVHPDDKLIERARQLSLSHPEQVALVLEKWIDDAIRNIR